jgi:hypothetical protein
MYVTMYSLYLYYTTQAKARKNIFLAGISEYIIINVGEIHNEIF